LTGLAPLLFFVISDILFAQNTCRHSFSQTAAWVLFFL